MSKSMFTTGEAAEAIGVCTKTIRVYCKAGRLEYVAISKTDWRIPKKSVKAFIERSK